MSQYMTSNELRQRFLDYFHDREHRIIPSSSLVPENDPTLLFVNAGMVPFKNIFLGREQAPAPKACSSQRCVRAGGKHNDLDNVGYTKRHHTFFEMLGNFSFGDYFKRDAIHYAWDFLVRELALDPEKLWVTVHYSDQEAENIWLNEVGVDSDRFSRCGDDENFWSMGDTGPCGPSSEIFYDHGPGLSGDPPGHGEEGDRYVEIWNLVFMQYDRSQDGQLNDLPEPCVDTGMGLERIASVMQNVHDNYHTDLFQRLMDKAAEIVGVTNEDQTSLRVISDHIRSTAFLITDGVTPSNEGRGYVLRRIIRRALRHGAQLGHHEPFFSELVPTLVSIMGEAYPDLAQSQSLIQKVLYKEEKQFLATIDEGMKVLDNVIARMASNTIAGQDLFHLYDTYGFPPDLTADIARERGLEVDYDGFERAMAERRRQSQAASGFTGTYAQDIELAEVSDFIGYEQTQAEGTIKALLADNRHTDQLNEGQYGIVVLDQTPFYAESGGQVGDTGYIETDSARFRVRDTQKINQAYAHYGVVEQGRLTLEQTARARVDADRRHATMLNHSATHLLHATLRQLFGEHAVQKGSLVEPDRLRFDFVHFEALSNDQVAEIETRVNEVIQQNIAGQVRFMTADQAREAGAIALFGSRYGEKLRVVNYGDVSMEPCGGSHVKRTGDIGYFKIIKEEGVASGVRRLEAVTGMKAVQWVQDQQRDLHELERLLDCEQSGFKQAVHQLKQVAKDAEKEAQRLKQKLVSAQVRDFAREAEQKERPYVVRRIEEAEPKQLRQAMDQLKQQLGEGVAVLVSTEQNKVHIVAGATERYQSMLPAGDIVKKIAPLVGGKGGGRADMAQGGGNDPANIANALEDTQQWIENKLRGKERSMFMS